jgi:glycosyltransferase involved in cell wall biosynthesis
MIVKNEENILRRCLDSYREIADEIVIVDTGSQDSTKKIAYEYTNRVYDFKWDDDFSHARNFAFEKATCDYIFSADADEVLDAANLEKFKQLKSVLLPEIDIVQMKYVNQTDTDSVYNSKKELRPKLFKRLRTFEWISPVHETIRLSPVVFDSDIEILHLPQRSHSRRDFSAFVKALKGGERLENYAVTMFCKELWSTGDNEDFHNLLPVFQKYMVEYTDESCFKEVNCVLARMYRLSGDKDAFFKTVLKQVADNPPSEICLELGNYYFEKDDCEEAALWYINAASETEPILDIHAGGDEPRRQLSLCYENMSKRCRREGNDELADTYEEIGIQYARQAQDWRMPEEI